MEILDAMDGLPVTVRLLDPPLHEFLPRIDELEVKAATVGLDGRGGGAAQGGRELARVQPDARHPRRPPRRRQARALRHAGAGADRGRRRPAGRGKNPIVEVMIPLTVTREELPLARGWVEDAIAEATKGLKKKPDVTIGTMIETPRAALRADEIAEESDFFSLRHERPDADDLRLQPGRRREPDDAGLPRAGPAQAQPVRDHRPDRCRRAREAWAPQRGRATRKNLKLGVCGEHGGDPESIALFYEAGLDYVSCSPFRVPDRPAGGSSGGHRGGCSETRSDGTRSGHSAHVAPADASASVGGTSSTSTSKRGCGLALLGFILVLLLVDLLVFHREAHEITTQEAAIESSGVDRHRPRVHVRHVVRLRRRRGRGVPLGLPRSRRA